jgi:hypothetical protein
MIQGAIRLADSRSTSASHARCNSRLIDKPKPTSVFVGKLAIGIKKVVLGLLRE